MHEATRYETPGFGATAVLTALHSPISWGLRANLTELRYQAWRTGRHIALPVSYARMGDSVVIYVAAATTKTWWRNFLGDGGPITVLGLDGRDRIAHAVANRDAPGRVLVTVKLA